MTALVRRPTEIEKATNITFPVSIVQPWSLQLWLGRTVVETPVRLCSPSLESINTTLSLNADDPIDAQDGIAGISPHR